MLLTRPDLRSSYATCTHYPRALVVAFDIVRRLPLEWVVLKKSTSERAAAEPLLKRLLRSDVVIMDRGYLARWLLVLFVSHGWTHEKTWAKNE